VALTKRAIDSFTHDGRSRDIRWDGVDGVPGFGVRVNPSSTKTFVFQYRWGRERPLFKIGVYGRDFTLQQARAKARELNVSVANGIDPRAPLKASEGSTLGDFAPVFLDRMRTRGRKSIGEMERRTYKWLVYHPKFSPHICPKCDKQQQQILGPCNRQGCDGVTKPVHKPTLGRKDLKAITTPTVVKLHEKIGKHGHYEANRVLHLLSQMFSQSEKRVEGMKGHPNPCKDVDLFKEESRTRYFDMQELVRLRAALEDEPAWLSAMIRFYLASGLRKGELLSLPWSAIHLNSAEGAYLDVSQTKGGRSHRLALTDDMIKILLSIPRTSEKWVFPSPQQPTEHLADFKRHWKRIRAKADLSDGRIHDLRRTTGSLLAQNGVSLHHIAQVLNHSSTEMTKVYARLSRDSQREALETMSGVLDEAFGDLQLGA
jgi:integrase